MIAQRTSPTNIGLYLLATVSARDFGWIGTVDTVERLEATLATLQRMLRQPPALPEGTSLALAAWNQLQTCPGTITADEATTVAEGFAAAFECTSVGPEPKASGRC